MGKLVLSGDYNAERDRAVSKMRENGTAGLSYLYPSLFLAPSPSATLNDCNWLTR